MTNPAERLSQPPAPSSSVRPTIGREASRIDFRLTKARTLCAKLEKGLEPPILDPASYFPGNEKSSEEIVQEVIREIRETTTHDPSYRETFLSICDENKFKRAARTIVQNELFRSCEEDDMQGAVWALERGADINACNHEFVATPLLLAMAQGNAEIVRLLIRRGAIPGCVDGYGMSAEDWAWSSKDSMALLDALYDRG